MDTTKITLEEVQQLSDEGLLDLLRKFSYPSQWENADALKNAEYRLMLIQGKRYMKTGDVKSFRTTNFKS